MRLLNRMEQPIRLIPLLFLLIGCVSSRPTVFHYPEMGITIIKDEAYTLPAWYDHPKARCFYEPPCTIYASTPECIVHELGHCEYGPTHDGPMGAMNWDSARNFKP